MLIIGVTGNIATGKTTVTQILRGLGAEVIDSDALVHEAYRPGSETVKEVAHAFGPHVMRSDGSIDRAALANIVFSNPDNMHRLESIVWPAVARLRAECLRAATAEVVVVDAVKLIESGYASECNSVWIVTAEPAAQRSRLLARGLTSEQVQQRLAAQPATAAKLALADEVITNNGSLNDLERTVRSAWGRTLGRAGT